MTTDEKTEDPARAFYLLNFINTARDFPQTQALSAAFGRELVLMNARQAARDAEAAKAEHHETPVAPARARATK